MAAMAMFRGTFSVGFGLRLGVFFIVTAQPATHYRCGGVWRFFQQLRFWKFGAQKSSKNFMNKNLRELLKKTSSLTDF